MTEDEINVRARALYDTERRVGWAPAWVNAHEKVRRTYRQRVEEGEDAGHPATSGYAPDVRV